MSWSGNGAASAERRSKSLRASTSGIGLVLAALLFAACGGAKGLAVASLGSTASTVAPAAVAQGGISSADYVKMVEYSACMRSHGVSNFPDPNSKGQFIDDRGVLNGQVVNTHSAQYSKANKACTHLLPNGGRPTAAQLQKFMSDGLKHSACMRSHGLPTFPDPVEQGGGVSINLGGTGISPNSPQMSAAMKACQSLAPGGGP